ncbi:NifU family protein [Rhodococcus indonesiensis]|uniref:NifU family protein n=1 Tax=Rhodococcus indonesiensis TaxID=3055869 RepID=UPI0039F7196E
MERWRESGERIEALLDASSAAGPAARERAEDLVREVMGLYGAGLAGICEALARHPGAMDDLARDDLVASLLLVHGLHPHDVETRVRTALDGVRPYLGSHGGDVELVAIRDDVVRLRLLGSCHGCPSSAVTLELAVQEAVRAAAPEITELEVETADSTGQGLIPAAALFTRVHTDVRGTWCAAPELDEIPEGEVGGFVVAGLPVLVCRVDGELLAYRDRCPVCTRAFAGATLHRRAGAGTDAAVLRCPTCAAHFDVRAAGVRLDGGEEHLEPVPVLVRDGVLSVAVPAGVA